MCVLHYYSRNAIVTTITCACGNGNRSRKFLLACPLGVHLSLSCFFSFSFLSRFTPISLSSSSTCVPVYKNYMNTPRVYIYCACTTDCFNWDKAICIHTFIREGKHDWHGHLKKKRGIFLRLLGIFFPFPVFFGFLKSR